MSDSVQNRHKAPYQEFSERLIDAMLEAGYAAREGSWSRLPVEIEPLRREARPRVSPPHVNILRARRCRDAIGSKGSPSG
ncbi:MAG: hypothetical protein ACJ0TD_02595 [Arenicellales bacterium]